MANPQTQNPIQHQKLKQVTSIFMQCIFFFKFNAKAKKNKRSENDILLTLVLIGVFNFTTFNLESIHVLSFRQTFLAM